MSLATVPPFDPSYIPSESQRAKRLLILAELLQVLPELLRDLIAPYFAEFGRVVVDIGAGCISTALWAEAQQREYLSVEPDENAHTQCLPQLTDACRALGLSEVVGKAGYDPPSAYCLCDTLKGKYNQPYFPEKESDEQSAKNAIRIIEDGSKQPIEISLALPRLQPITTETRHRYRYYVPQEVRGEAKKLKEQWKAK